MASPTPRRLAATLARALRETLPAAGLLVGAAHARPATVHPGASVLTYHNDPARTGQNLEERLLAPGSVNARLFGKRFVLPADGYVYAQPLVVSGLDVPGKGKRVVVYVATEHDSVYAFDYVGGSDAAPELLWRVNFLDPARKITTPGEADVGTDDLVPEIGITGTPVIDAAGGTLYCASKTKQVTDAGPIFEQRLHALDLVTGAEKLGGPVVIQASVPGTGDGSDGYSVAFNALREHQRPGLALVNGVVYVAWASHGDNGPYHGWVIGYDAKTLKQVGVFNTCPNGGLDGIWMSGAAPAVDEAGNLYVATGNGTFDPATGSYGESLLRLSPANGLKLADYFTPYNFKDLNDNDTDLGSGGVLLLPDSAGGAGHPHLLFSGGKEGKLYLVDRGRMGHVGNGSDAVVQTLLDHNGLYSTPAYFNGAIYYCMANDRVKMVRISNGRVSVAAASEAPTAYGPFNATPSISANGSADGIVWCIEYGNPGVLHAYDARDLSRELYNSRSERDDLGPAVKFTVPTVANGRVFVGTVRGVVVYGLLERSSRPPAAPERLTAHVVSSDEVDLTWKNRAVDATGIAIERAAGSRPFHLLTTVDPGLAVYRDAALMGATEYRYRIHAVNSAGDSRGTRAASARTPASSPVPGLVGRWTLDEGAGTIAHDSSGGGADGRVEGEVTWVAGHIGSGAARFHGVGRAISHIAVPDRPAMRFGAAASFTLSLWADPAVPRGRAQGIAVKSADAGPWYGIGISPGGDWSALNPSGDLVGAPASPGWHHLSLVQDGAANQRRLFADGILVAYGPAAPADGPGDFWIGGAQSAGESFAGGIDDVRIYDRALSESEVHDLAASGLEPARAR